MQNMGNSRQDSGWTTTTAAAKSLNVSPRTVRLYIERGELTGKLEEGTDKRVWLWFPLTLSIPFEHGAVVAS